jgi:major membrane immunogen (membrane-anchored lipoprotein)
MNKILKFGQNTFFTLMISLMLSSCSSGTLRTAENIPRKVVISNKNGAALYTNATFEKEEKDFKSKQWEVFFIIESDSKYFKVSRDLDNKSNKAIYIKPQDAFEWNSNFCLGFKNSPHENKREVVKIYKTAKLEQVTLQEKEKHTDIFRPEATQPILETSNPDEKIYKIATLYDRKNKDGIYEFFGDHDFGYVKFEEKAYKQYRYISKGELELNIQSVLAARNKTGGSNKSPDVLTDIFNLLGSLVSPDTSYKDGAKDIERTLTSKNIPDSVKTGIFQPGKLNGQNMDDINEGLQKMYPKMIEFRDNSSNWINGHGYIPIEWIKQ